MILLESSKFFYPIFFTPYLPSGDLSLRKSNVGFKNKINGNILISASNMNALIKNTYGLITSLFYFNAEVFYLCESDDNINEFVVDSSFILEEEVDSFEMRKFTDKLFIHIIKNGKQELKKYI